jgi:uncharacterized peroxidase-related enzyme
MTFIDPVPESEASEFYEGIRTALGEVPNYTLPFSLRPELLSAWQQLNGTIKSTMDSRRYELATLAAARRVRSSYCMLAHGKVLLGGHLDADELEAIATDHRTAGLDAVDVAVMDLAEKVADDAGSVTQDDVDHLRSLGLSDAEVFDVVAAAAARAFFTKIVDGLGARPDAKYAELEAPLRDALVVGRPIADAG